MSKIILDSYITPSIGKMENKKLNLDKINNVDDIKRVLEFLNISANVGNGIESHGYSKVKDLFE